MNKIYGFSVRTLGGREMTLEEYEGRVLLIVNTASKCGLAFQLKGLDQVYRQFRDRGFEVLAFPSDSFKGQEFAERKQIEQFCILERGVSYPMFDRIAVKGPQAHPLFKYLADRQQNGRMDAPPLWNYHKYLIDRHGNLVTNFKPWIPANSWFVKSKIQKIL
jgi:glutathione peroxidase